MREIEITGEYIELANLLKISGLCQTGGHAKMVITDGDVTVDGEIETRRKRKIRRGQVVEFEAIQLVVV